MEKPRFTLICRSADLAAAGSLRSNAARTIGEPFEFDVWDNRRRNCVCNRVRIEHFSTQNYPCGRLRELGACHCKRARRLPLNYVKYRLKSLVRHG